MGEGDGVSDRGGGRDKNMGGEMWEKGRGAFALGISEV